MTSNSRVINVHAKVKDQSLTSNITFCIILELLLHLKKNPLDQLKGLHKLKLLTNVGVNLTSLLGEVINYVINV